MSHSPTLRTFLWFNDNLEDALDFYSELFGSDFNLHTSSRPEPAGKLMTAEFSIYGHELVGMGYPGGPEFNPSISLSIACDGQAETDRLWDAITQKGQEGQCGWCVDEFGVSWQISPIQMGEHLGNPDSEKAAFAWQAMRGMKKIVIADLISR
jgi:predicted 3-demethylubiquinone-9 3-methyltransferase (glyoxalase superfamily)